MEFQPIQKKPRRNSKGLTSKKIQEIRTKRLSSMTNLNKQSMLTLVNKANYMYLTENDISA